MGGPLDSQTTDSQFVNALENVAPAQHGPREPMKCEMEEKSRVDSPRTPRPSRQVITPHQLAKHKEEGAMESYDAMRQRALAAEEMVGALEDLLEEAGAKVSTFLGQQAQYPDHHPTPIRGQIWKGIFIKNSLRHCAACGQQIPEGGTTFGAEVKSESPSHSEHTRLTPGLFSPISSVYSTPKF